MWVIILRENLEELREGRIDLILGEEKRAEQFLTKRAKTWNKTTLLTQAHTFRTEWGATSFIKKFSQQSQEDKNYWTHPFFWIRNSVPDARVITLKEWQLIIDTQINKLERDFQKKKEKLLKKRDSAKGLK